MSEPLPYPVAARQLLRDTLLDATRDELVRTDWASVRMADVAKAAGVSRQTLYNEFGSRDELGQALVLREGERFLVAVEAAIKDNLDAPHRALELAFDVFLVSASENPLVRAVVFGGASASASLLPLVTTQGEQVVEQFATRLSAIIREGWPQVAGAAADLLAEALVRLAISYATLPKGPSSMTAASVTALLGPYLDAALAAAAGRAAA